MESYPPNIKTTQTGTNGLRTEDTRRVTHTQIEREREREREREVIQQEAFSIP
jgi:hypothetical protein